MILIDITGPIPGLKKENQMPTAALIKPNRTAITILIISPLLSIEYFLSKRNLNCLVKIYYIKCCFSLSAP